MKHEVTFNPSLKRLILTGYGEEGLEFPMTNNGHTGKRALVGLAVCMQGR